MEKSQVVKTVKATPACKINRKESGMLINNPGLSLKERLQKYGYSEYMIDRILVRIKE